MVVIERLLFFTFIILVVVFLYKYSKKEEISSDKDIQKIISDLEVKIRLLEIKARQGIKGAQEELEKNKTDLEEIIKLKEKLKN